MNISRRQFLKRTGTAALGAMMLPHLVNAGNTSDKPNILCLTTEDISPYLGCYGDKTAYTPNLDQLAAEGIKFTNVFANAGVCAPARASLITGLFHNSFGANHMRVSSHVPEGIPKYEAMPPAGVKCFSEFLRADGYYCTNNVKTDYQFQVPVTAWDDCSNSAHWKNRPDNMPFFSIFNHMTTHESQVWDRANDPVVVKPEEVTVPPYYPDTYKVRRDIARVYSNITVMDREVGELIDALKKDGLWDNTIVIFYSDHGGPLPRGKRELCDTGLHVPMLVRFPKGKMAGKVVDDMISFVDIPATILSLANIKPPAYMHGRPFLGKYKAEEVRQYIYGARDRMDSQYDMRRAVRDKNFKYIKNFRPDLPAYLDIKFRKQLGTMQDLLEYRDDGKLNTDQMYWFRDTKAEEELYDIQKDPYELNNLAADPRYKEELLRLRRELQNWLDRIGDTGFMSEEEMVKSFWPDLEQPVTKPPQMSIVKGKMKLDSSTEGASIAYQINGKGYHKNHWLLYTKPFKINKNDEVTATAIRIGYEQSEMKKWRV